MYFSGYRVNKSKSPVRGFLNAWVISVIWKGYSGLLPPAVAFMLSDTFSGLTGGQEGFKLRQGKA